MTIHQISLSASPINASIARFAALRQRDRVYGKDNQRDMLGFDARNAHVAGKLLSGDPAGSG